MTFQNFHLLFLHFNTNKWEDVLMGCDRRLVDIPNRLAKGGVVASRSVWNAMSVPYLCESNMGKL